MLTFALTGPKHQVQPSQKLPTASEKDSESPSPCLVAATTPEKKSWSWCLATDVVGTRHQLLPASLATPELDRLEWSLSREQDNPVDSNAVLVGGP